MKRSRDRILTTHAGSLPRPNDLTRLYVRRSRGEAVDSAEIERAGRDAVHRIVPEQIAAGVDVLNNGEQQRESFFLYLRDRASGFGGSWERPSRQDVDRYPGFEQRWLEQTSAASKNLVSNLAGMPMAIGDVRYGNDAAIKAECADLQAALDAAGRTAFVDPFMNAPSPGIVATAMRNEHYDTDEAYLEAIGRRSGSSTRRSSRPASSSRSTRPISRLNGT